MVKKKKKEAGIPNCNKTQLYKKKNFLPAFLTTTKRDRVMCGGGPPPLLPVFFVFFCFLLSHVTFRYTFLLFSSMGESWEIFFKFSNGGKHKTN